MSENVKSGFLVILITIGLAAALGVALYFYVQNARSYETAESVRVDKCQAASSKDTKWRLFTGSVPSPNSKWRIYSTGGVLCHVNNGKTRAFSIDTKMLKKIGCTDGTYALYCRNNGQPQRHPRYEEIMNP